MLKRISVILVSLSVFSIRANIEEIHVKIDGFVSEHCAEGVTRKLSKIKGIQDVSVTNKGLAYIKLEENNKFNLLKLKPIIEGTTSYKIKQIKVVATGKIERLSKYYTLNIEDSPHKIFLTKIPSLNSKIEKTEPSKKSNFLVQTTGSIYAKTMGFFKNFRSNQPGKKFTNEVRMHCKHNAPIKFEGIVYSQADGSIWLSKAKAKLKEIDDKSDLFESITKNF
ncbi:heavy-metal-associated domain-containing protein [Candidatus Babeliales bacterium]|nr:heavy-metal-associated domain-containing protein [Candidatus Babeliales bacterium]